MSKYREFNDKVAEGLSFSLSTMECFWIVTVMVTAVLFWQRPNSLVGWITYLSSAVFQASALPVLGYTSKLAEKAAKSEGAKQAKLVQETHDSVMTELAMVKQALEIASDERDEITQMLTELKEIIGCVEPKVPETTD